MIIRTSFLIAICLVVFFPWKSAYGQDLTLMIRHHHQGHITSLEKINVRKGEKLSVILRRHFADDPRVDLTKIMTPIKIDATHHMPYLYPRNAKMMHARTQKLLSCFRVEKTHIIIVETGTHKEIDGELYETVIVTVNHPSQIAC